MKTQYEKIVYIAHPYGGSIENEKKVAQIIRELTRKYPSYLFVSGIHAFSFAYFDVEYQKGLNMCLWLLNKCDSVWVYGDWKNSKGCHAEIDFCKRHSILYKIIEPKA